MKRLKLADWADWITVLIEWIKRGGAVRGSSDVWWWFSLSNQTFLFVIFYFFRGHWSDLVFHFRNVKKSQKQSKLSFRYPNFQSYPPKTQESLIFHDLAPWFVTRGLLLKIKLQFPNSLREINLERYQNHWGTFKVTIMCLVQLPHAYFTMTSTLEEVCLRTVSSVTFSLEKVWF